MRCNNCGWDNAPGSSTCVKCGHPLQMDNAGQNVNNNPYQGVKVPDYSAGGEQQPRPTVINSQPAETPVPRPTRIVNGPIQQEQMKSTVVQTPSNCPHCGYPVMGNFTSCPNCGAEIAPKPTTIQNPAAKAPAEPAPAAPAATPVAAPATIAVGAAKAGLAELGLDEHVKCDKCGAEVSIDFTFCPKCGERIHLPTIRAIRHKPTPAPEPPKPKCHLTLIPEEEEQMEPVTNDYEGASVILTRENTEANNRTITSKEQAELICEDGKWFLLNKSELGSTYLEANRKLELQQGDVIVMGDRRFKFEAEDQTDKK